MKRHTTAMMLIAIVGLVVTAGCDNEVRVYHGPQHPPARGYKKITVTFVNTTNRVMRVHLDGPAQKGTGRIGTLDERGDKIKAKLKIRKSDLPAQYVWRAGPYEGRFVIIRNMEAKWVKVGSDRAHHGKQHPPTRGYKKITVTFINTTNKVLKVHLDGPAQKGTGRIGTLDGRGDKIKTKLKISKSDLPAQYVWRAGRRHRGRFTITRKMEGKRINIGSGHPPRR